MYTRLLAAVLGGMRVDFIYYFFFLCPPLLSSSTRFFLFLFVYFRPLAVRRLITCCVREHNTWKTVRSYDIINTRFGNSLLRIKLRPPSTGVLHYEAPLIRVAVLYPRILHLSPLFLRHGHAVRRVVLHRVNQVDLTTSPSM